MVQATIDLDQMPRAGSVQRMPIKLENVGIAVRDLEAAIAFFTDLGLLARRGDLR